MSAVSTSGAKPDCAFCEALRVQKSIIDFKNNHPEYYGEKWNEEYSVALVIRTWPRGRPKRASGRITDYRYRGCGYKLNYCPTCGKKV